MPHLCALKFQEPTVNETDRRQLNCAFQVDMTDNVQGGDGCPVTVTWSMNGSTFEITETEVTFLCSTSPPSDPKIASGLRSS